METGYAQAIFTHLVLRLYQLLRHSPINVNLRYPYIYSAFLLWLAPVPTRLVFYQHRVPFFHLLFFAKKPVFAFLQLVVNQQQPQIKSTLSPHEIQVMSTLYLSIMALQPLCDPCITRVPPICCPGALGVNSRSIPGTVQMHFLCIRDTIRLLSGFNPGAPLMACWRSSGTSLMYPGYHPGAIRMQPPLYKKVRNPNHPAGTMLLLQLTLSFLIC